MFLITRRRICPPYISDATSRAKSVFIEYPFQNSKMSALQFDLKKKQLSIIELPAPTKLSANEVLIKVAYAGICGTDLHIAEGAFPCGDKVVLGHEFSGIIQAIGSNVTNVKVGDKVSVDPNSGCGTCHYCTDSNYHYCEVGGLSNTIGIYRNGGWANYCTVPDNQVFKLPEKISLEQAALAEPISCISHGWDKIQPVAIGKDILIQGAGIIGNLWSCLLHLQGHRKVIVSEPQEARRKLIAKLNTGYEILTPSDLKARKTANPKWGVDLVVDCSGYGPAIEQAIELLNPGGRLCIFGVASPETKISVSPYLLFKKEITINAINVNPYSFNKSLGFIDAMGDRYLNYEKLGIKTFTLKQHDAALKELKTGSIAKAVFKLH